MSLLFSYILAATVSAAEPPLPAGRYGMVLDTATISKLPFIGKTPGGSRGWLLVDISGEGAERRHQLRTCDVIVTGAQGHEARVEVPAAFIAAIPRNQRDARLLPTDGGGWSYSMDMGEDFVGYDPARHPGGVPDQADHPAVTDFDGDGQPGATMLIRVPVFGDVAIYVAQRAHIRLDGRVDLDGGVRGGVTFLAMEQRTLAASHSLFASTPEMTTDPSRSGFVLRPMPADTDCRNLRQRLCEQGAGCDR